MMCETNGRTRAEARPTMLEYDSSARDRMPTEHAAYLILLRCLTAYFIACTLTLPFIDTFWIGEVPLLALVQVPKITLAEWLRTDVVMVAIRAMGVSRGSFSPDYGMARPYALAIAYWVPLAIVLGVVWMRARRAKPIGWWMWAVLITAVVDFGMTLLFGSQRGLTIY